VGPPGIPRALPAGRRLGQGDAGACGTPESGNGDSLALLPVSHWQGLSDPRFPRVRVAKCGFPPSPWARFKFPAKSGIVVCGIWGIRGLGVSHEAPAARRGRGRAAERFKLASEAASS
jgi:hypothetical protein